MYRDPTTPMEYLIRKKELAAWTAADHLIDRFGVSEDMIHLIKLLGWMAQYRDIK